MNQILTARPELFRASRLPVTAARSDRLTGAELCILFAAGACAAIAESMLQFSFKVPGHAIVRSVLPMVVGLSLVPRRGSGTIMGMSAIGTLLALRGLGFAGGGAGAMVSMIAVGPLLDVAVSHRPQGWRLYARLTFAAVAANILAFASRFIAAQLHWDVGSSQRILLFWPSMLTSYVACAVVAGLIASACAFRFSPTDANYHDGVDL